MNFTKRHFKLFLILAMVGLCLTILARSTKTKPRMHHEEEKALEALVHSLVVYEGFDEQGSIKLIRHGHENDGGYIVPEKAFIQSDVLMGYGIASDISFEEEFANLYNKDAYGFDCGVENISIKNPKCVFISECIGTDQFLYQGQKSSQKIASFAQQINRLGLSNKKIFIKMDIEGAEYEALPAILDHHHQINGLVLEIHFTDNLKQIKQAKELIEKFAEHFILVHLHANNCCDKAFTVKNVNGTLPKVLELSFINKSLITHSQKSAEQSYPKPMDMVNCPNSKDYVFKIKTS